jgi:uncharacterized membrane protein YqjE
LGKAGAEGRSHGMTAYELKLEELNSKVRAFSIHSAQNHVRFHAMFAWLFGALTFGMLVFLLVICLSYVFDSTELNTVALAYMVFWAIAWSFIDCIRDLRKAREKLMITYLQA